jgi:hypothetical protein
VSKADLDSPKCRVCENVLQEIEQGKHQELLCKEILRSESSLVLFLVIVASTLAKGTLGFLEIAMKYGSFLGPQVEVTDSLFRVLKTTRDRLLVNNNLDCASFLMDVEAEIRAAYAEMGLELETRFDPAVLN